MIQELLSENTHTLLTQNQNHTISRALEPSPTPSPSSSTTTTTTTATTATTATTTTISDHQKLRCPRCDSSHTKFCYYNNYNLTQPRHFCKTCRRYWTKGGALRNVPIGGGCRKTKGGTNVATAIGKPISATGKLKTTSFINGFELEPNYHNPIVWSHPPQTSHLLSLFRPTKNPNPNPNFASNSVTHIKDQSFMVGSNMGNVGFESLGQTSSLGLCSSLWRNNQDYHQKHHEQHDDQQGMRSSSSITPANYYNHDHQAASLILGGNYVVNTSSSTSTSSTILDSAPVLAGGEFGLWNQTPPWSDLAAANGAYP